METEDRRLPARAFGRWSLLLSLGLPVLTGIFLRLYQLSIQIPADDEWHAVHISLKMGYRFLLTHFGGADYCIPFAVFYRLASQTVGLSEAVMHTPALVAGIIALVLFPLFARVWISSISAAVFAWLLALHPLLCYFSRYARPYSVALLFGFLAVLIFHRGWRIAGRLIWLYPFSVVASAYFHLTSLPFTLSPLAWAGLVLCFSPRRAALPWRRYVMLVFLTAGGLITLLGPPMLRNSEAIFGKVSVDRITFESINSALQLLAGTGDSRVVVVLLVLAVGGMFSLWRSDRDLFVSLGFVSAVQIGALMVLKPLGVSHPEVLARYLLPILPVLLLFAAEGLILLGRFLKRTTHLGWAIYVPATTFLGLWFVFGPIPRTYYYPNAWTNHALFQYTYNANDSFSVDHWLKPLRYSDFYIHLGKLKPGSLTLLEVPWYYEWSNNIYPYLQHVHHQQMKIGLIGTGVEIPKPGELGLGQAGVRFRNFVHVLDYPGLRAAQVKYVIFHKNLSAEIRFERERPPVDLSSEIVAYRSHFGRPVWEDSDILVFDVDPDATPHPSISRHLKKASTILPRASGL